MVNYKKKREVPLEEGERLVLSYLTNDAVGYISIKEDYLYHKIYRHWKKDDNRVEILQMERHERLAEFLEADPEWAKRNGCIHDGINYVNRLINNELLPAYETWLAESEKNKVEYERMAEIRKKAEFILGMPITESTIKEFCKSYYVSDDAAKSDVDRAIENFFIMGSKKDIETFINHVLSISDKTKTFGMLITVFRNTANFGKAEFTLEQMLHASRAILADPDNEDKFMQFLRSLEELVERKRVPEFFTFEQRLLSNNNGYVPREAEILMKMINSSNFLLGIDRKRTIRLNANGNHLLLGKERITN
jgi:hypothetical protein